MPIYNDGDHVATWPDSSGAGRDAVQATSANQPIFKTNILNGKPVVRFDGSDDYAEAPNSTITGITSAATFIVVQKVNTVQDAVTVSDSTRLGTNTLAFYVPLSDSNVYFDLGNATTTGRASVAWGGNTTNFFVWSGVAGAGSMAIYRDGTSLTSVSGKSNSFTAGSLSLRIGGQSGVSPNADIAEVILYNVALSSTDRANIEKYLGTKYGLTVAGGTAVDPSTVSGLQGWWKADSMVAATATALTLTGPSSGIVGTASTAFTVALSPVGGAVTGTVTVTPSSGAGGGTFSPTSVALTTGGPFATFTYTPATTGAKTISVTNNGGLTNPSNLTYTSVSNAVTALTISGPSTGMVGVASTPFTVGVSPVGGVVTGTVTVTPSAGAGGGTFSPTTVGLTTASPTATFAYTPVSTGAKSIAITNNGSLTNPSALTYTVSAVPATALTLTGPNSGVVSVASSPFTVALSPAGGTVTGTVTVTPSDSGAGGTFTPTTVGLTTASPSATFTYTPVTTAVKTVAVTNNGLLTNPLPLPYLVSVPATAITLSGPTFGVVSVASTPFTVALSPSGGAVTGTVTVTPNDSSGGGTFTPTTVGLTTIDPYATFTYTPASTGSKTIGTSDTGGLTDPTPIIYLVAAVAPPPSGVGMIARMMTYAGQTMGLLLAQPNWDTEVKVSLELPTDVSKEPITFNESRRNFSATARYTMTWTSYLFQSNDATELRLFLTRLRGEPVLVPLWPDACEIQTGVSIGATSITLIDLPVRFGTTWIIAKDNFSSWELVTVTALDQSTRIATLSPGTTKAWLAGDRMFPMLMGKFDERPRPEAITDETFDVELKIRENSQFAYRVTPAPLTLRLVGSHISTFATTPMWDVAPNFVRPLDWTEMPDVVYEHVGFLRQEQQRVYDHRNARGLEFEYFENARATAAKIEFFWRSMRATTLRFMIPTYKGDMRMLLDTPVGGNPTWIVCEVSTFSDAGREAQPGDPFIALIDQDNSVDPYQLASATEVTGTTRLVATISVGAHVVSTTIVSHLLLARFQEPTLEWSYTTPYLATTRIKFQELPHEYSSPPTPLPEPAYIFWFFEVGVRNDLFTSYENTITIPAGFSFSGTYTPAPFSFSSIKASLKLDAEKLEIKSFKFDGNPLNKMWPFALDGLLQVGIAEVNAANPQGATTILRFFGDIFSVDSDYKATAIPFGNFFDRKFPRFLLSVSDNYTQYSGPTKIAASSFDDTGTINGSPSPVSQTLQINSSGAHAQPADYYAGGWLETGSGVTIEKRGILSSTPSTGIIVILALDRPLVKAVGTSNQAVTIFAGYDGSITQCESKFGNLINFGGHAYIPNTSPALKAMKPTDVQGGKKRG